MNRAFLSNWRTTLRAWRGLRGDSRGVAAVEFALIVPIVIVVYAAGFELTQAATVNRKLTDTTVQMANVTSRYTAVAKADIYSITGASAQIMAPYSTTPLAVVLSEVYTDNGGVTRVQWSEGYPIGGPRLATGSIVTMPPSFASPNSYYILSQTTYGYVPTIGAAFVNTIPMSDQIFMVPREFASIPCSDCDP